jgi:hypothetical protein
MKARRVAWAATHAVLLALTAFSIDSLLLKFDHPRAYMLPGSLVLLLGLVLLLRAMARRVPEARRHALHRMWCSLDHIGVVWLVFFFVLLTVFHSAFSRASGDGREYFSQLHSAFIDHDLDLSNEARDFGSHDAAIYPFGSAVLWAPFYLLAHLWLSVLNAFGGGFRHDGYFYPYQMAIGLGTMVYGFTGLILIYRVACDYFTRSLALASTIALSAGSFIVWYLTVDNSYTHGNSLFAVTLFLFLWYRSRAGRSRAAWGWLGLSGGLMVMVRWQNAVFLAPLALDVLLAAWQAVRRPDRQLLARTAQGTALASAGFVIGFLPQMYFWKAVNGGWLAVPHGQAGQQWWRDSLMSDVLFSPNHGLFSWHPIIYVSVLGAPLFLKRDRYFGSLLAALFVAQVYINGAVATWWGGSAFGGRRFDGCAMFFVLGLAALIHWCQQRPAVLWASSLGVLLVGNVFLMQDVFSGRLPMGEGIGIESMFDATARRLGNPFSFPANAIFAWRYGTSPAAYDRLGLKLFNNVVIDVGSAGDERFLASGWSDPERERDVTFRWAVTRQSSVGMALMGPRYLQPGDPQQLADYVLRIRAAPFVFTGSPPQIVSIDVNNARIAQQTLEPVFREYEFPVPHEILDRSLNIITFGYQYARSPQELGMINDPRQLSVRFDYIHLVQKSNAGH